MIKQSLSPIELHVLCDQCRVVITSNFNFLTHTPNWQRVLSKHKRQTAGQGRVLDFCTEKCRIVFLRGKKYYQRKLAYMAKNGIV